MAWPGWHESPPANLALNVAAYVPVGLCACMLLGKRLGGMAVAVATGASLSLAFECTQSMSAVRVASWVDVISNGLGTVLGAGLAAAFAKLE